MLIINNIDLPQFQFWGGAEINAAKLTKSELDELDDIMPDLYPCDPTVNDINDMFRYYFAAVCALLGYDYDDATGKIDRHGIDA